jgi:hypothetical protein
VVVAPLLRLEGHLLCGHAVADGLVNLFLVWMKIFERHFVLGLARACAASEASSL